MRSFLTRAVLLTLTALCTVAAQAQQQPSGRVVLVLPFDNRSGNASLNWIGDSFPDTLDARLNSSGFLTISQDDRAFALDHLGLPAGFKPSRATSIRIAQQLDADFVIVGSYNVNGDAITIQAQVLDVSGLHLSAPIQGGAPLAHLFDAENSIAWKIAKQMDPHFSVAEQTFLAYSAAVPLSSFENYIRGTDAPTSAERLRRLMAAVNETPAYSAALLALGKEQYAAHDYTGAARTLARVPINDRHALEADFYLGLAQFNSTNYSAAEKAFALVATRLPLPEVVNDEGVAEARQSKDASALFRRASSDDLTDEDYHYNLAVALYRVGNITEAGNEINAALKLKPADNEALQLRARLRTATSAPHPVSADSGDFAPVVRIRRTYSEAGFRQAAFQIDQLRAARMAMLAPTQQAVEDNAAGRDYLAQGLIPEAEQEFQNALTADPNSAAAHAGLAEVREQSADPADARTEALTSLKLQPNAAALLVLARLDAAQNLLTAALDETNRALQIEPQNTVAIALRLSIQQRMSSASAGNPALKP